MNEEQFLAWLQGEIAAFVSDITARMNTLGGQIIANYPRGDGTIPPPPNYDPSILYFHSDNGGLVKPFKTKIWKLLINNNDRYTLGEELASKWHPHHGDNVKDLGLPQKAPYGKAPVIATRQTKWSDWKYVETVVDGQRKQGMILKWHHGYWADSAGERW